MGSVSRYLRSHSILGKLAYTILPYGKRFGGRLFHDTIIDPNWSKSDQYVEAVRVLENALEKSVFYEKRRLESLNLWESVPILERDTVRSSWKTLSSFSAERPTEIHTSGSTGHPLSIYADKSIYEREAGFIERYWRLNNASLYKNKTIWLRRYSPDTLAGDPLWYYDPEQWRLYMSPFHFGAEKQFAYIRKINETRFPYLVTYPTMLKIVLDLMKECNRHFDHLKGIFVASETFPKEWQFEAEEYFQIPVRTHYGHQEKCIFHYQCEYGEYHEFRDYGYTEVLDDGRIIATGFGNPHFPLIRYDTGDTGEVSGEMCDCGREISFSKINGRLDDYLISTTGCKIPAVNFYSMMYHIGNVGMFTIIQNGDKSYQILYTGHAHPIDIKHEFEKRVGYPARIYIQRVDELARSKVSGKMKIVRREM